MIKIEDFNKIPHNPLGLKGKLVQSSFDIFQKKIELSDPDGHSDLELSDLLTFVIIFINKKSPLWDEKDFDFRQREGLKWAKIEKSNPVYKEIVNKTDWYLTVLHNYFKYVNDVNYETWVSLLMYIHNANDLIRRGTKGGKDSVKITEINNLAKELPSLTEDFLRLQQQLFPDQTTLDLINAVSVSDNVGRWAERKALTFNN